MQGTDVSAEFKAYRETKGESLSPKFDKAKVNNKGERETLGSGDMKNFLAYRQEAQNHASWSAPPQVKK